MASPNIFSRNGNAPTRTPLANLPLAPAHRGFSFIEMMVVLALIGVIATWGIITGFNSFSQYNFRSETDAAVSLLQKARSSAVNNISESPHGVYFGDTDDLILFRGATHDAIPASHIRIEKSDSVTYDTSGCPGEEVTFAQLSGRTTDCVIVMANETQTVTITVNTEGGIIW